MSVRIALIAATLGAAACSSGSPRPVIAPTSTISRTPSAAMPAITDVGEIRVRLDGDIGVDSNHRSFSARLTSPLLARSGLVVAPPGSLVYGHVVSTNPSTHRVELAFDRLETRDGVYRIGAVVVSAAPFAITVRPETSTETATLQAAQPSAIGGGPGQQENVELPSVGEVVLPFDAEVTLKLTEPPVKMEY